MDHPQNAPCSSSPPFLSLGGGLDGECPTDGMAAVAAGLPLPSERRKRRDRTRWGADEDNSGAGPSDTQAPAGIPSAPALPAKDAQSPATDQPRRPKRSRWASEEADVKATVPGLAVPVSLPASLAGLVDANPQAMALHRQLGLVRTSFSAMLPRLRWTSNFVCKQPLR